jgi:hypothetical protein
MRQEIILNPSIITGDCFRGFSDRAAAILLAAAPAICTAERSRLIVNLHCKINALWLLVLEFVCLVSEQLDLLQANTALPTSITGR